MEALWRPDHARPVISYLRSYTAICFKGFFATGPLIGVPRSVYVYTDMIPEFLQEKVLARYVGRGVTGFWLHT